MGRSIARPLVCKAMNDPNEQIDAAALQAFVEGFGVRAWAERLGELEQAAACSTRLGRAACSATWWN